MIFCNKTSASLLIAGLLFVTTPAQAKDPKAGGDLDDGIAIDDDISNYHELNRIDKNISFMVLNQWSKSMTTRHRIEQGAEKGDILVNSIKLAPGTTVHGDLTIIDNTRGDHTVISTKK